MMNRLVHEEAFRIYLNRVLSSERLVRDCISRCRRVEQSEGNLYAQYTTDRGESILKRLSYGKEEADQGLEPEHGIIFKGSKGFHSILEGTASLRNAVQYYFDFLSK